MKMASKTSLQLEFLTDQNKKVRVTVDNPKLPIDSAAVGSAMDLLVAKSIFAFAQGNIVKKIQATEVQTTSTVVS
jgi:hypothetical protein